MIIARSKLITIIFTLLLTPYIAVAASLDCRSGIVNPVTDVNWNNMYPMVIGGQGKIDPYGYPQPSYMKMTTACLVGCSVTPPVIGIGLTMWSPEFMAEVHQTPGCMPTFGGVKMPNIFGAYSQADAGISKTDSRQMNVHWFKYPLFAATNIFSTISCGNSSGVLAMGDMTELDNPFWQDNFWSNILNPDIYLYANPIAMLACLPDVVVSSFSNPLDVLVWCVGSQGLLFPITGQATNSPAGQSIASGNMLILAKFMQGMTRQFRLMLQIGPPYHCAVAKGTPYLIRGQYRIDPAKPLHTSQAVRFGKIDTLWSAYPPLNPEGDYSSTFFIWQGLQCCIPVAP